MAGRADVLAVWDEGRLLRGVRLSELPPYRAGQALRIAHEGASAYFAIATAYGNGRAPELLLRRGGGVAEGLIGSLQAGSAVEYVGPGGPGFPLEHAHGKDVLLVAAGAGISAIRAVIDALIDERERYQRISLFYGQERAGEFAYEAARADWAKAGIAVTLCARDPDASWRGARGQVHEVLASAGPGVDRDTAVAYLCGMPGMVVGVREVLASMGLPPERTFLNF